MNQFDFSLQNKYFRISTENGKSLSYSDLQIKCAPFIKLLKQYPPKSRIGLFTGHNENFITGLFSIWLSGNIPVPLGNIVSPKKLADISEELSLQTILYDDFINELHPDLDGVNLESYNTYQTESLSYPIFSPEDTAVIILTSGSSGTPKAVPLTYNNFISSADMLKKTITAITQYSFGATLPFFHIGGFSQIIRAFLFETQLYIPAKPDSENISTLVSEGKAGVVSIVPSTLKFMIENNISPHESTKVIFLGGAASNNEDVTTALEKRYPLYKVYGSSETCAMVTIANPLELKKYPASSGKVMPGVSINVVDQSGADVGKDRQGKIVISSPTLSPGYLNHENLSFTANQFIPGDLGYINQEGYLFVTGRSSRMIISGGYNINPDEIEKELSTILPEFTIFVTAVADKKWGERPVAVCQKNAGKEAPEDEYIIKQLASRLPSYKIPRSYIFVDKLPLTQTGKPDKPAIDALITSIMSAKDL